MKILVLGYTGSGKSTAADIIADIIGSSPPVNTSDILIYDFCTSNKLYIDAVINNKNQYRNDLFNFGVEKQKIDPRYPVPDALKKSDVITGVRTPESLQSVRNLFDHIIWIDRLSVPRGSTDKLSPSDCTLVINNDGTIEELKIKLTKIFKNANT